MKYRTRIYYSEADKALMWDRWQAGDSLHEIARLFDRGHSSIQSVLSETGGIRPRPRSRSRRALSLAEREEISRGVVAGQSLRSIATSLGRAPSTVSREINRNDGLLRQYFPKGMDLSNIHQNRLNAVARQLNERPRKTLNFRAPAERFNQCVALTG